MILQEQSDRRTDSSPVSHLNTFSLNRTNPEISHCLTVQASVYVTLTDAHWRDNVENMPFDAIVNEITDVYNYLGDRSRHKHLLLVPLGLGRAENEMLLHRLN